LETICEVSAPVGSFPSYIVSKVNVIANCSSNANFKPSYKQSNYTMLIYNYKVKITAFVNETAENSYGEMDILNSTVPFSLKEIMINNKDGLPDILSF
jgi:hypothetical protein